MRIELRQAILNSMDRSEMEILIFSAKDMDADLHWKNEFQFDYRDKSYEVANKVMRNDTVIIWCKKEVSPKTFKENLREVLVLNMAGTNNPKEHHFQLFQWFKSLKPERAIEIPSIAIQEMANSEFKYHSRLYNAPNIQPLLPPPDFTV